MDPLLGGLLLLLRVTHVLLTELELPLCPTNIQFLPQNLPMHCRMPANAVQPAMPPLPAGKSLSVQPAIPSPFYQNLPPGQQSGPMSINMPQEMSGLMTFGQPGPMPILGPPPPVPPHKLPVIVMPFYSPDPVSKKHNRMKDKHKTHRSPRRRPLFDTDTSSSVDTDTSSDASDDVSTDRGWWRKRVTRDKNTRKFNRKYKSKKMRRKNNQEEKEMLTPLLQYVTKDGYVIYEKEISKNEAQDWLDVKQDHGEYNNKEVVDKQADNLNESAAREYSPENYVSIKANAEENVLKPLPKRNRPRSNNPGKLKAL